MARTMGPTKKKKGKEKAKDPPKKPNTKSGIKITREMRKIMIVSMIKATTLSPRVARFDIGGEV